ncbi:MAG TPA: RNA methyltransferase [Thermoanaerobaculia bacterium]|nr:RNA methyltransferase [Thermoanaerobaculia bacterium]
MPKLRIVLVEPREAGNVGAVARVMKNFGFDDLRIVGEHPQLLPVSIWWASGADDLLERAQFSATLLEAIGDAHLTIATTSSRGRTTPADFTPRTLAVEAASLRDEETLALVFGREDSGLTREEMMLCQRTAVIPANAQFPTMNLAQSACVFCYELSSIVPASSERVRARAELVERLHERAQAMLLDVGFLHANNPDRIYNDLRAIAGRAALDEREAEILLGMLRQLEWKLKN